MGKGLRLGAQLPLRRQRCYLERRHSVVPCRVKTGRIGVRTRLHRWVCEGVLGAWQTLGRCSGNEEREAAGHKPLWPQRLRPLPAGHQVASGSKVQAIEGGRGWSGAPCPPPEKKGPALGREHSGALF